MTAVDLERFGISNYFLNKDNSIVKNEGINLIPLQQEAPSSVQSYHAIINSSDYFAKIYSGSMTSAEKELTNYKHLEGLNFIPQLLYTSENEELNKRLFIYEYLSGNNLHSIMTRNCEAGKTTHPQIIKDSISQIVCMSKYLDGKNIEVPDTPWALKSPVRAGLISDTEHEQFLADYKGILEVNREILNLFPGYYFDRNTRNIMNTSNGVYQVDLGVIEYSSPLFDMAKLLRNGSDKSGYSVNDLTKIQRDKTEADNITAITHDEESSYLDYAHGLMISQIPTFSTSGPEFRDAFEFAGLHTHLFYLTKYSKLLRDGLGSNSLVPRVIYHTSMAYRTLDNISNDVNTGRLKDWVDFFVIKANEDKL